jgi:hypothetical protein
MLPEVDPTSGLGVEYMDLADDQCTLRYTSFGESIKQFNVCTRMQMPNLVQWIPEPGYSSYHELIA